MYLDYLKQNPEEQQKKIEKELIETMCKECWQTGEYGKCYGSYRKECKSYNRLKEYIKKELWKK